MFELNVLYMNLSDKQVTSIHVTNTTHNLTHLPIVITLCRLAAPKQPYSQML
ncbi:MAG: hypothetical protein ACI9LX_002406 [Paraglaciecola sp.]|jgi:hypothetical protein